MFKVGNYVVYKKDVCKVEAIKKNYFNNGDYYILAPILDQSLKINVPIISNLIRNLISKKEVEKIIIAIPNIEVIETDNKLIENEYKKLISLGNHEDLIKIIKTTYLRNKERLDNHKKIGDKDDAYFKLAEKYLYSEFMIVLNMNYEDTKKYVTDKVDSL